MNTPTWSPTRHRMLRRIVEQDIILDCVNKKAALWKPRSHKMLNCRLNLSSAEARAVNDFAPTGSEWARTPDWQGDMDVYRHVVPTDAAHALLAEWDEQHPTEELKP